MQILATDAFRRSFSNDSNIAKMSTQVLQEIKSRVSNVAEPAISQASKMSMTPLGVVGTIVFGWAACVAFKRTIKSLSQCSGEGVIVDLAKTVGLVGCTMIFMNLI